MSKAIGMIEFKTTATGVTAADAMVKTSEVEIVASLRGRCSAGVKLICRVQ